MPTSLELEDRLRKMREGWKPVSALRGELETQRGLPTMRNRYNKIQKQLLDTTRLLENVKGDVASRAVRLGGPVTEGMRRRLTAVVRQPIVGQLHNLGQERSATETGLRLSEADVNRKLADALRSRFTQANYLESEIRRQMSREAAARSAALRRAAMARSAQPSGPSLDELLRLTESLIGSSRQARARVSKSQTDPRLVALRQKAATTRDRWNSYASKRKPLSWVRNYGRSTKLGKTLSYFLNKL